MGYAKNSKFTDLHAAIYLPFIIQEDDHINHGGCAIILTFFS